MPIPTRNKDVSQSANKTDKHIEAALDFVRHLYKILSSDPSDAPATDQLVEEINQHVKKLHNHTHKHGAGVSGHPEIDQQGTRLWNICTRLRRDCEPTNKRLKRLHLHGRVLAFHLLVVANPIKTSKAQDLIYVVKLALKAARDCVESSEFELATRVLQKAADYKSQLQDLASGLPKEEVDECNCLEVEYLIMRTALSWADNHVDVAEHMYTKAERLRQYLTPEYAEKLADVLYEIGKSLASRNDFPLAKKMHLSREGLELRLAILQALVSALLATGASADLDKATKLVEYIESEMGNRPVVSLLKLEVLRKTPAEIFDDDAYADVLRRLIKDFNSSDAGFKLIIHHIRKLHDKSPGAACAVLDDFTLSLRGVDENVWMEKAVITRMWMITSQRDTNETIDTVRGVLSNLTRPLSAEAAVAAQALIWKKLESNYSQRQYDIAENWCRLSLHHIFQNCGPGNVAKLERKLLLCALARNEMGAAISVVHNLSKQSWGEPMTAYLAFKVAIRCEDRNLAEQCIHIIGQAPEHVDFLGACIAESHKKGDIFCAIAALKKLQENYEYKDPSPIHLPALFRCLIRLLNILAEKPDERQGDFISDLCRQFDIGKPRFIQITFALLLTASVVYTLERQSNDPQTPKLFTIDELEWFSRNAYNLALKHTTSWDLRCVVRLLTACVNIINHFPSDMRSQVEVTLKALFSRFIIASALVSFARTQDNVKEQLEDYQLMRKHVSAFDRLVPEYLSRLDEQSREDMVRKHATLLTFDFEAAVALGQWDDLGGIVQRAVPCRSAVAFQTMADSLLRAQVPGQVLYSTMRKLVNEIWDLESFDAVKLAKYTRCLFQATLPLDDTLAMKLLQEACRKARELHESDARWPEEELEWMAATAFNHAIDLYGAYERDRAKKWGSTAINLAHYCPDKSFERMLQDRFMRLSFEDDERNRGR
ncbi:SPO22-domain-containing protein [Neurospora tetrasperma FGSC 2509]|nr:SPO22-domain-containing protein [Neurospora tetrasperma FGSC 2509]